MSFLFDFFFQKHERKLRKASKFLSQPLFRTKKTVEYVQNVSDGLFCTFLLSEANLCPNQHLFHVGVTPPYLLL